MGKRQKFLAKRAASVQSVVDRSKYMEPASARSGKEHQIHLRVMECRHCGKTHRELPEGLVPYKRHDLNSLCEIAEATETQHTCETSTWLRIRFWLAWFLWYAQNVLDGLITAGQMSATFSPGHSLRRRTASFVRLVVNSGNWEQHRSAMTRKDIPSILVSS